RSGQVRVLASTGPTRNAVTPDLPVIAEYVPGYEVVSTQSLFAPAKTPREIVGKISADTNTVLAEPAIRAKLAEMGHVAAGFARGAGKAPQVGNRPVERTHQVSRHHTRLIISAQMPMRWRRFPAAVMMQSATAPCTRLLLPAARGLQRTVAQRSR